MTRSERLAMLRGAAYMREKISQALETSPRGEIYEIGAHVRHQIKLPSPDKVNNARRWVDQDIAKEGE